jgi:hypothetical protein
VKALAGAPTAIRARTNMPGADERRRIQRVGWSRDHGRWAGGESAFSVGLASRGTCTASVARGCSTRCHRHRPGGRLESMLAGTVRSPVQMALLSLTLAGSRSARASPRSGRWLAHPSNFLRPHRTAALPASAHDVCLLGSPIVPAGTALAHGWGHSRSARARVRGMRPVLGDALTSTDRGTTE